MIKGPTRAEFTSAVPYCRFVGPLLSVVHKVHFQRRIHRSYDTPSIILPVGRNRSRAPPVTRVIFSGVSSMKAQRPRIAAIQIHHVPVVVL